MFYQSEVGCCNIYAPVKLHLAQKEEHPRPQQKELSLFFPQTKLQHTTSAVLLLFAVLVVLTKVLNKTVKGNYLSIQYLFTKQDKKNLLTSFHLRIKLLFTN